VSLLTEGVQFADLSSDPDTNPSKNACKSFKDSCTQLLSCSRAKEGTLIRWQLCLFNFLLNRDFQCFTICVAIPVLYSCTECSSLRLLHLATAVQLYMLQYSFVEGMLEKRGPYRQEHLDLLTDLTEKKQCLIGGAFAEPGESLYILT
jgi:hypothetical protein